MLPTLLAQRDWNGLLRYLSNQPHSRRRQLHTALADSLLPQLEGDAFWAAFLHLSQADAKEWLGTLLKALLHSLRLGHVTLHDQALTQFGQAVATQGRTIDRRKTLRALLPAAATPGDVKHLLQAFGVGDIQLIMAYLVPIGNAPSYYVLFQSLRQTDASGDAVRQACHALAKQNLPIAYNLVAILKAYYGLTDLPVTLSLQLKPYQLARLEQSYETVVQTLTSI